MSKVKKENTTFFNAVKAQTSGLVSFEYTNGGLKIRPVSKSGHNSILTLLKDSGVEFYTLNRNPEQKVPPSTDSNEVIVGLRDKGIIVSNARQLKRNGLVYVDGVRNITLLPLWVITISQTEEHITNLIQITGILNFVMKIQGYKVPLPRLGH